MVEVSKGAVPSNKSKAEVDNKLLEQLV